MPDPSAVVEDSLSRRVRVLEDQLKYASWQISELLARMSNSETIAQLMRQASGGGGGGTPIIFHAVNTGSAIAAATSSTQMTSGTITFYTSDNTGLLTIANTQTVWNKSTTGTVLAGDPLMVCQDAQGQFIVFWEPC